MNSSKSSSSESTMSHQGYSGHNQAHENISAKYGDDSEKNRYFFDSYAIIELLEGNESYRPYTNVAWVTTKLNLFEVATAILRNKGKKASKEFLKEFRSTTIEFDIDTIEEAAILWTEHRKSRVSMTDTVGYTLSQKYGLLFLTGDRAFSNMQGVRFVR